MDTSAMILTLATATGVAGLEHQAVEEARKLLKPIGTCETTALGSLLCRVKTAPADKPHVMLTAHIDSIGMIVTYIDDSGFLRVSNCGGVDRSMVLASQVTVHTAQGALHGVVCTIPPHLNPDDSRVPKMEEIYIDVGMDSETAHKMVALGDRVTFIFEGRHLLGDRVCSGAFDDRAGCAAVILAAEKLRLYELDCALTVALTSMEEVGAQGAKTAAHILAPTHAVAVDVSFGHTPDAVRAKCGLLGEGPMIGISPILDNEMFEAMKRTARKKNMPCQIEVMGGNTGTDADAIVTSGAGVKCALLSIPQRYMHTPIEVIEVSDVDAVADLIAAYVMDTFGGAR